MADTAPPAGDGPAVPETNGKKIDGTPKPDTLSALPPPVLSALDKIPDEEARAVLSVALSRTTTFGFGPDPETAKIISQAEMHEEDCKLQAYKASLLTRGEQNERDHQFRKKRLNHQTFQTLTILLVTIGGVGAGLYMSSTGNGALGTPVLIASFTVLTTMAGKLLGSREKD